MNNKTREECPYPREHLEWRWVIGYEGIMEVSNYGDFHIIDHYFYNTIGHLRHRKEAYKWSEDLYQNKYGYKLIYLPRSKSKLAHVLVAQSFIPNINNKQDVNHIDGIKNHNYCGCKENNYEDSNLEWATRSENVKHAYRTGLKKVTKKQKEACYKNLVDYRYTIPHRPIIQLDKNGIIINKFSDISEAAESVNIGKASLYRALNQKDKKHLSAGGYIWAYEDEYDSNKDYSYKFEHSSCLRKKVIQYSLNGDIVAQYDSIQDAAKKNCDKEYSAYCIGRCANGRTKTYRGFLWEFVL